jgi:hypothetical protein
MQRKLCGDAETVVDFHPAQVFPPTGDRGEPGVIAAAATRTR